MNTLPFEKNVGKRCILKNVHLQECPFFPAPAPFRVIGYNPETKRYLIEGPWTTQIRWTVKASDARIIDNDEKRLEENPFAQMSPLYEPVEQDGIRASSMREHEVSLPHEGGTVRLP